MYGWTGSALVGDAAGHQIRQRFKDLHRGWGRVPDEIDEGTWGRKKKPYRYRWPEEVHDEVLARLLDLNQKRAEEERLAGLISGKKGKKKAKHGRKNLKAKRETKIKSENLLLFDTMSREGDD